MSHINNKLLSYIKDKPNVYEESSSAFWDDEHISKHMLEAHLTPNFDGASRLTDLLKLILKLLKKKKR